MVPSRRATILSGIHPETAPPSHGAWAQKQEDEHALLEERFSQWTSAISHNEDLFKKHVYENADIEEIDLRQHRARLYFLLFRGEELAVDFMLLGGDAVENFVAIIEQKLDALRATLHAWHGPLDQQGDIPESFKQGVKDIADGKVVEMEAALNSEPPQ